MKKLILFIVALTAFYSCKNQDIEFPDYDYSAVYFAYQYPVRTITIGEDIYDTSLDNAHKCKIFAALGGVYEARKDVTLDIAVADSLCTGFKFANILRPIKAMPSNYYTLASNKIVIKKGEISGGVEVQLTDAFFNDPLAVENNYVIPIMITNVSNADSILKGKPVIPGTKPRKLANRYWDVLPKDYVLYAVKYINKYTGYYLRRGTDVLTGSVSKTIIRHPVDVSTYDAATAPVDLYLNRLTTTTLSQSVFPVTIKDAGGNNVICNLKLTFDASGNCTVASNAPAEFTATGSGKYVEKGEKNSFGNKDRDVLYLDYSINHTVKGFNVVTKDTMVMRNRGVVMEKFSPVQ